MQVDSAPNSELPSLDSFLASVVTYKTSPAMFRSALRQHLPDADDVICILEVLDKWLAEWSFVAPKLLPPTATKNPLGVFVAKPIQGKRKKIPSLAKVWLCFWFSQPLLIHFHLLDIVISEDSLGHVFPRSATALPCA